MSLGTKISPIELFLDRIIEILPYSHADRDWLMGLDLHLRSPINKRIKRLLDLVIACFGIVMFSPFGVIAAVAIVLKAVFRFF